MSKYKIELGITANGQDDFWVEIVEAEGFEDAIAKALDAVPEYFGRHKVEITTIDAEKEL